MGNVTHATVYVSADLRYTVDLAADGLAGYVFVGNLQLCFWGDPATQMAAIDRLSLALTELRDANDRRASEPLPTADDVRGILAEGVRS